MHGSCCKGLEVLERRANLRDGERLEFCSNSAFKSTVVLLGSGLRRMLGWITTGAPVFSNVRTQGQMQEEGDE